MNYIEEELKFEIVLVDKNHADVNVFVDSVTNRLGYTNFNLNFIGQKDYKSIGFEFSFPYGSNSISKKNIIMVTNLAYGLSPFLDEFHKKRYTLNKTNPNDHGYQYP
ncbi:hypothetical protein GCM10022395_04480 [Snuella lapsa]|uniref:Uncharacterized protein n=2 Tax=Snuella lapsa TaxID=870481 RepID=A0ABP6WSX5_9FLAO